MNPLGKRLLLDDKSSKSTVTKVVSAKVVSAEVVSAKVVTVVSISIDFHYK